MALLLGLPSILTQAQPVDHVIYGDGAATEVSGRGQAAAVSLVLYAQPAGGSLGARAAGDKGATGESEMGGGGG